MPVRTFRIHLANNTKFPLVRTDHHLCHGDWTSSDWEPPRYISSQSEGRWQSESSGIATGTEGWVKYRRYGSDILPDPIDPSMLAETIYVYWNNPYLSFSVEDPIPNRFRGSVREIIKQLPEWLRSLGTSAKCSVTSGNITADCDEENQGNEDGAYDEPVNFEIFRTSYNNAGAAYNDDLFVLAQVPIAPLVVLGTYKIVEHAIARITFRGKGSVKQALPLGYDSSKGIRIFQSNPSVTSVRSIFSL